MLNSFHPDQDRHCVGPDLGPDCCHLLTFFFKIKSLFSSKNSFWNTIRVSSSLDPDLDGHCVSPDLGPDCCHLLNFFLKIKSFFFLKILLRTLSECQTDWIRIRADIV